MLMRNPDWVIEDEKTGNRPKESNKELNIKAVKELAQNGENEHLLQTMDTANKDQPPKNRIRSEMSLPTYLKQNEKVPFEVIKQLSENKDMYNIIVENYPNLVEVEKYVIGQRS
ncbi:hypothetical protein NQ314_018162 [Rhamnusium bicolor]|uniref:Uncharacterized protein n=1 Tax=Rhamnusium bicolor TaxID=1586634 RepID=A0AAV8WSM7_9CUCU|nr:hypothetical protein NQ314_018162 [Rhamnusium bicolor]